MDDWLAEFSTIQSAAVTLGTTQKGATCGRRKKQLSINKVTAGACPQNFVWWHGGKFSQCVFQKAVLPKSMARKAARQGILVYIIPFSTGSKLLAKLDCCIFIQLLIHYELKWKSSQVTLIGHFLIKIILLC